MRQVSARDAGYVFLPETVLSSRVLSCWILATPDGGPSGLTADRMVPLLADRLAVDDMFRSVLRRLPGDIDLPYWVLDPTADPADHVTVHPPRGLTWRDTQSMLAEIADRPFDMRRPLWSVDVVTDVDGIPGRIGLATVVAVSFHHAAFDGISFESRLHTLLADDPAPHRAPTAIGPLDEPWSLTVCRALVRIPIVWSRFLRTAVNAAREARRQSHLAASHRALYPRGLAPTTRFNTGLSGGRHTDFLEADMDAVEAIASLCPGATINDVLLSIVGGALADFLTGIGEPPARPLACLVPKTTRRRDGDGPDSGSANQFIPLSIGLHTDIDDIVARIEAIARSSSAEKERASAVSTSEFWRAVTSAPAPLLRLSGAIARRRTRTATSPIVNTVLSTIVSETPVATVGSVPVVSGFGFAPLGSETTLSHVAVIGLGRVRLIATADITVLTDMPAYMQAMQASLDKHLCAVRQVEIGSGCGVE